MAQKVLVAMSGGVDSSVAAALLNQQGYFVTGGYMKNFSPEAWEGILESDCPWQADIKDVKAVCKKLGIVFRSFNFEKEYTKKVIDYFFSEYKKGRTPNPDILCNSEIKFGIFLEHAKKLGFDYIATGHYAKKISKKNITTKIIYSLKKGRDKNKDQSYFLYRLNQAQLAKSLFPVGNYTKTEIRALARKFKLPVANKKDSQGVCFVGHIKLKDFLKQRIKPRKGDILNTDGEKIGEHEGSEFVTIGQRHGLNLGGGTPYYVVAKDIKKNTITVSKGLKQAGLYRKRITLNNVHWIGDVPKFPFSCKAKIRYRQDDQSCVITKLKKTLNVTFAKSQFAVASGQSVVFYYRNTLLGGGIII